MLENNIIYRRKVINLYLYALSEELFNIYLQSYLDFAKKLLNPFVIIPAQEFYSRFILSSKEKRWDIDPGCARVIIGTLARQREIGCLFAQYSSESNPYTCLFPLHCSSFIREIKQYCAECVETRGAISSGDLVEFAQKKLMPTRAWPGFFLKHLYFLGWGRLKDSDVLVNSIIVLRDEGI
jgi:hypothetical protein